MKKAQTVSKANYEQPSLDYEWLREKALSFAQQFSGNIWTDYHYHDPGVTFMEQLCYAITVLAYRTQFPITDLLYIQNDSTYSVRIDKARTDMPNDIVIPTGWLAVFINDLTKWKFITNVNTQDFVTATWP